MAGKRRVDSRMNTCYIFCAGPIADDTKIRLSKKPGDSVICADGGYSHAVACGVMPDWLVGDFDSNRLENLPEQVIRVKPEKDDTDFFLALNHGISLGYRNFVVYGALGGRMDHTWANIQTVAQMRLEGISVTLLDEKNEVTALLPGEYSVSREDYPFLSLFAFSAQCEGVTLTGMKYPLTDYCLKNTDGGLTVSNEILKDRGTISFRSGLMLMMRTRD